MSMRLDFPMNIPDLKGLAALAVLLPLAVLPLGCGDPAPASAPQSAALTVGRESLARVARARLRTGPVVSGTLAAEREATVRAEVAGPVLATHAEEGERVARGQMLARVDDAALREAVVSARSALRSAEEQVAVNRRNAERATTLLATGAIAEREAEGARWGATNAEALAADARSRLKDAEERLGKAVARAPFAGVVSRRAVMAGDTVQPGSELYTVVDPTRLRLEAQVPAERLRELAVGAPVEFTVSGMGEEAFTGSIDRINPVADPATRQVQIYVAVPNPDSRLVAGLYAEGRVAAAVRETLAVPVGAVERGLGETAVLKVEAGRVVRVPVELGIEDEELEMVEVVSGASAGDLVLTGAARGITPGTAVSIAEHHEEHSEEQSEEKDSG